MGRDEMEQGVYCYHGNLIIYTQRGCSGDFPVKGVLTVGFFTQVAY